MLCCWLLQLILRGGGEISTSSIVFATRRQCAHIGGQFVATWRIRLNRPPAAAKQLYYVKLLWPLVFHHHQHHQLHTQELEEPKYTCKTFNYLQNTHRSISAASANWPVRELTIVRALTSPRSVQFMTCPVRELTSPRVGNPRLVSCLLKATFHYAIQVADLRARVVCVSQAGRKLVKSQLGTGLRPGSSYLDMSR